MLDDEVYEVTRDDFKCFMGQIKPDCFDYETTRHCNEDTYNVNFQEVKITSKDGKRLFAKVTSTPEEAHYYVYEMPHDNERQAPKRVRQITLETKEEVQHFFETLNKIQKGEYKHD